MHYKIKRPFTENILLFFYNSRTYKLFVSVNAFFKNSILKHVDKSLIINLTRKAANNVTLKDAGAFILLVVLFNTLAMIFMRREIDIFSIFARISFLILGIVLIWRGQVSSRN